MGQFPSTVESAPPQSNTSISSFSRPSFLRPFFQRQQKTNNQFWLEDTDRKDFESFVQRIFSYQSADGSLNLPENYSQSTFDSLIQSLMKQLDKYLELQPIFEQIDKSVVPFVTNSFTPNKIIKYFNFTPEKNQPFIDFVLQLYNDLVSPKPTPENIDIFLNLFSKFSSSAEVYSPLMTSLLHHITSILLLDNDSSQKLCQILINHLNSQYSSIYYVMALVDAILMMPSLSVRIQLEPKLSMSDQISYKPVNENITTMRARLGENAIVQTACHYQQQSFILTNDNSLYKVSTKAVKLVKLDKITSPARLSINRRYLYVFQCPSTIDVYDHRSHLSKTDSLTYTTPSNHELVTVCTYGEKELFLLFHQINTNIYQLEYLNSTQINVGSLIFKKPPICMSVSNNYLKIATNKKLHVYEVDFDNFKIAPMVPNLLNIPRGWKLLSMQEDTFLAMKPARSHLQLAYLRQTSPLSFLPRYSPPELPEVNGSLLPKDVISMLINDLVLKLSAVVWRMILEQSVSLPDIASYEFDDNFILFLVDIVKKSITSQLEMNTLIHLTFVILTFILIHFNDEHQIEDKITDKIIELLTILAKMHQICSKTDILLTIFLIIDHGFIHLFKNNPERLIELAKLLCSSQQTKEQFALFIPLLVSSPALLYLLDKEIFTILYENTSSYTTFYVIQNSFAMLIDEYMRCKKENMSTSRLIMTLKVITEGTREYFPKEFVLMVFTFFLRSLNEMKLTSLIVSFFEFLHPTVSYFDKKFKPEQIISDGKTDDDAITEQVIETKHPVGNDNKYCWDISFPGATAIEVEFDPSCSILIDDQDVFQILGGCSATSPIVYEKEPKSMEPFPKKLYINSSSARVIFRSFAGYHLHGLKMIFRRIDRSNKDNEKIIDSFQFYLYYFFHCIGDCISTVFQEQTENPKMNCCQFMLWMKKIELPCNSLSKTQQVCKMVPESFMNMITCEMKNMQRIKATPEIQEIETLCVSAALNQLEFTETVLNSKRFEEPANLRATTKKLSNLMLPRSPYPGNNKKPPRPTIVVPSNNNITAHANTIIRQSLMTPKERSAPISQSTGNGMTTNEKVNSFLKMLWKLIYQMRTRIYYAKQKSKAQYELQLKTIRDKAKYFASVRSVFEPVNNSDSLEVLQSRANQILRVISAEFSLNDMFSYVDEHIEFQSNQANMIKQLEKFAHKISHQHLLMQIFYPLCKRLMGSSKVSIPASTATAFKTLFQSLSKHFMQVDSQPDNSFQLMTLLSNFALVGFNESQSEAVFAAIHSFIGHNQNTVAWQLFIHYAMNVSTKLFEDKAKYFFESGIVAPTLLLKTLLILEKGDTVTNLSFVSSFLNSKQPNMIRSVFLFLSAYYAKSGIQEDFSVKIGNKTMENEDFFRFLLKMIGERASGKLISLLPKEVPIESHMMIYSEITSFFRICIKKTSRVNDFLLRLFDSILLDFTKNIFDESIIGIFIILGEGFFSLKANSYAIHDKASSVMKLEDYSPYLSHSKLQSLLNRSVVQIDKKKIIGYPRIPPCPSDFPMTKFRINAISYIVNNFERMDNVLFSAFSLYLNVLLQDLNSLKMIIEPNPSSNIDSFELVQSLLKIANQSSFEGQYHSMAELIESASEYISPNAFSMNSSNEKLEKLIKLNSNVKVGNILIDDKSYYYEFTLLDDMKTTNILIGFVSDDCSTEYHSFAALNIQKKMFVLNGVEIRGTELPVSFDANSTIGCLFENNSVSFIFNDKPLTTSYSNTNVYSSSLKRAENYPPDLTLPLSCHRYTPIIISSNTEIRYKVNFGNTEFKYKVPTCSSQYEIIDIKYNQENVKKQCQSPIMTTNSLEENDDYLQFLRKNNPVSTKNYDDIEFNTTKFPKPYFSHQKEIFESKKEISPYLKNIKGQPFIINSKLNPFNKKIGILHKIGKDGKFILHILDVEIGKIHTAEFDESLLERINFHYFPMNVINCNSYSTSDYNSYHVFRALSVRAIRYSLLHIFNIYPHFYCNSNNSIQSIDSKDMSNYLSKMLCELIPYNKEYKKYETSKGNDTIFASTLMSNSIISINNYRVYLLNVFDQIIENEKHQQIQSNEDKNEEEPKTNSIIELTRRSRRSQKSNYNKNSNENKGIIANLYQLLIMEIERMNSPSYEISEFNFLIETTHPLSYTRIDRTIITHEGTHYMIIPDPLFNVISRGLLIKGSINPFLVRNPNDIENLVSGNKLYLNLSNNKQSPSQYGCRIHIIPQFIYSSDSIFTPISWILHFGTSLLHLTINKIIPYHEVNDILIPLLLHDDNKILNLFKFQLLSPILFTSQRLNEGKLYELCLPLLSHFRDKFSILKVSVQEEAITLVSSFVRLHSMKFKEIIAKQVKTTRKINAANISNANNFSEFRRLMKSGQEFMKELGHKRLEFIVYLLPFLRVESLCPYFIFFKHYFEGSNSIYIIESQPSAMSQILNIKLPSSSNSPSRSKSPSNSAKSTRSPTPSNDNNESSNNSEIVSLNTDDYKDRYFYHFRFEGSRHQRIKFTEKIDTIPPNISVLFTSPKDPSLHIEINSSKIHENHNQQATEGGTNASDSQSQNSYNSDYSEGNFLIHSDDFFIEIKNNDYDNNNNNSKKSGTIPSIKMKIIPTIENASFPPQLISEFLSKFLSDISMMNKMWLPMHDTILSPHIKSSNILSVLPPTSMIKLNEFPDHLIKSRFSFIKELNELFNGEIGQLPLNDFTNPIVNLITQASSAFSSAMKLSRLEKIICKNFNQKKSFSFNRSRALLAKSNPESPEAKSLFDQVIDQIPTTSLSALKCKDAPWRVTLEGEGATDVGGPGRDLFTEVSSEICMPHNRLFILTPRCVLDSSIEEYVPDPRCAKLERFVYVGAFVALAFVTRLQQPYRFSDLIWSYLSGKKVTLQQIYEIDPSFKTLITSVKKGEIAADDMKFTVKNVFGEDVELIPNGASVNVLSSNVDDRQRELDKYCNLAIEFRVNEFNPQLKKMKEGFSIFLGEICTQMVTPDELKSYICGSIDIPIQELRQLIQTTNATPEEEEMLYEVLEEFSVAERMLFIKFATGKMSVPAPGASWNGSLNVEFVKLKPKKPPYRLPLAATCSSTVSIPRYPTKEILAEKLRTAITYGSDIVLDHAFDAGGIIE